MKTKDSSRRVKDHDQSRNDIQASQRTPFQGKSSTVGYRRISSNNKDANYEFRRNTSQRRPFYPRYQGFFTDYCFWRNNFGHNAMNCRAYGKNIEGTIVSTWIWIVLNVMHVTTKGTFQGFVKTTTK